MDMLQSIRAFATVASTGGFTAAARNMKVGTPQVSRAIAELEAHLGLRLFNRTTRSVVLTVAGERYLVHCQSILASLEQAEAEAAGMCGIPTGTLHIGVAPAIGRHHLVALVLAYQERYPNASFEISLATGSLDVELANHDVLLVCGSLEAEEKYASACLGSVGFALCASTVYLARHGIPRIREDLSTHRCLQLVSTGQSSGQWIFDDRDGQQIFSPAEVVFQTDLIDVLANATLEGLGIAALPISRILSELCSGALVRVLPRYRLAAQNVYAICPVARYQVSRVHMWIEFLKTTLPARLANDQAAFISLGENSIVLSNSPGERAQEEVTTDTRGADAEV